MKPRLPLSRTSRAGPSPTSTSSARQPSCVPPKYRQFLLHIALLTVWNGETVNLRNIPRRPTKKSRKNGPRIAQDSGRRVCDPDPAPLAGAHRLLGPAHLAQCAPGHRRAALRATGPTSEQPAALSDARKETAAARHGPRPRADALCPTVRDELPRHHDGHDGPVHPRGRFSGVSARVCESGNLGYVPGASALLQKATLSRYPVAVPTHKK